MASNKSKIEMTRFAVSGGNLVGDSATECVATAVKPETVLLLLRPMTTRAMRLEERLDVTYEVNLGGFFRGYAASPARGHDRGEIHLPHTNSITFSVSF
jgi:hypothetical protein